MKRSFLWLILPVCVGLAQEAPTPKSLATGAVSQAPIWAAVGDPGPATAEGRVRSLNTDLNYVMPSVQQAADGTNYWVVRVQSDSAAALGLHFSRFSLPEGMRMFVMSIPTDGSSAIVYGPLTGSGPTELGELWTPALPGSELAIELQWNDGELLELPFEIDAVGHHDAAPDTIPQLVAKVKGDQGTTVYNGVPLTYQVIDGVALTEGDIVLGSPEDMAAAKLGREATGGIGLEATGVVSSTSLWPNGVVPYAIDPALPNQSRITDAANAWNTALAGSVKFVPWTNQPYYVKFTTSTGCSSYVGYLKMAGQPIYLADACSTGNAIHEMGHALGLWHEHTRNDRDSYVTILTANIDPSAAYNFNKVGTTGVALNSYDYNSIMHYGAYSFSINGQPTITTIPAGISIGQRNALSTNDINGIRTLYPSTTTTTPPPTTPAPTTPPPAPTPVAITITSAPAGLSLTVDGANVVTPAAFSWLPGSSHTVSGASQTNTTAKYVFSSWSNGGAASQTLTTPSASATYVANFSVQYKLTDVVAPSASVGTIKQSATSADSYFPANTSLTLTATPSTGYCFAGWSGTITGNTPALTLSMTRNQSLTASFQTGSATVSSTMLIFQGTGGTQSLTVTAPGCSWSVTNTSTWATTSVKSGSGNTTLGVTVPANPSTSARAVYIQVGGKSVLLYQYGKK